MAKTAKQQVDEALAAYKQRVFEKALEVQRDMGWCNDGFKSVMEDLDIDAANKNVEITVTFTQTFEIGEVGVFTEDDIREAVDNEFSKGRSPQGTLEMTYHPWYHDELSEYYQSDSPKVVDVQVKITEGD